MLQDCECLPKCPFFHDQMENMPAMSDIFKRNYCQGDNMKCARHWVYERFGPGSVPNDLFPNDADYANSILNGGAGPS